MTDTRTLSIIEPTAEYHHIVLQHAAVKKEKNVLIGCLAVLSIAVAYVCYKEYQRRQNEA